MSRPDGDGLRGTYLDPSVPVERFQQTAAPAAEADDNGRDGYVKVGAYWVPREPLAAPAAEADELDLRAALQPFVWSTGDVDAVMQALAGPLQRLVEQAAEAARLRAVVARVEEVSRFWALAETPPAVMEIDLRRALDGTDA